ncbi:MAG: MTAP family purine nucleoside phosphorylase [Actinomycetota bacterium]|jgi:5'-deoxy-5'-methylthioadenosine phosphorylase|nr:MTAP family purine nucleoside phosphorylase [Actinomycetota bacterium]
MIGIIAGTGYYDLPGLMQREERTVFTEYGDASVLTGLWNGVQIAFVTRHGGDHSIIPSAINYRANIRALADLGVEVVFAVNVVGSMLADRGPGTFVLIDDFIEFTTGRASTFHDRPGEVKHTDMTDVYDPDLRAVLSHAADLEGVDLGAGTTYVCANGPRFETPAEIRMYARLGAGVVGMTGYPEVALAREAGLRYASVAVVSNAAAGMQQGAISDDGIWEMLEGTKDPLFRLLGRAVQLHATGEC